MTKDQLKQLEKELWNAADNLRANSDLKSSEYAIPVLGLIFLKFADNNYRRHEAEIMTEYQKLKGTRREKELSKIAIDNDDVGIRLCKGDRGIDRRRRLAFGRLR